MQTVYRGWVPTVTGRLSFSHFGYCDLYPTKTLNRADPKKRYLVTVQRRETWDALIPLRILFAGPLLGLQGRFRFICVAETKDTTPTTATSGQALLVGRVFIITEAGRWQCIVSPLLKRARSTLKRYFFEAGTRPIGEVFGPELDRIRAECLKNCAFYADFSLQRNGTIEILVDDPLDLPLDAPRFPIRPEAAKHIRHILAAQAFSFLRDVGHRHKHHHPKTDTIVDLYEVEDGDDEAWRRGTLYSIYRRIITHKRRSEIGVQISSIGLLAYAKAFKKSWQELIDDPAKEKQVIPAFYDDALKESIQASETEMRFKLQIQNERSNKFRTVIFGVFGTAIAFAGLAKLDPNAKLKAASPAIAKVANILLQHPGVLLLLPPIFWCLITIQAGYWMPQLNPISRYVQALTSSVPRIWVSLIYLATTIVLVAVSYLIYPSNW